MRQILLNLVANAVKFTEQGEIVIRAMTSTGAADQNQIMLKFEVTDTGIGIPQNRLHRLFRSFSQVDASTTRKYGATGLGLVISKQLAELMGGPDRRSESNGARFYLLVHGCLRKIDGGLANAGSAVRRHQRQADADRR